MDTPRQGDTCLFRCLEHDGSEVSFVLLDAVDRLTTLGRRVVYVSNGVVNDFTKLAARRLHVTALMLAVVPVIRQSVTLS